jgi:diguanylate cyclase (GGDEF)-like protein
MEIRLYLQMLLRGWWIILLAALVALTASLGASYLAVPQYQATARFIINPGATLTASADVVRSLDTLDRPSVAATYVEVMNSQRILTDSLVGLNLDPADPSLAAYNVQAIVLPSSSVLQLTVIGPNPNVAAALANAIGNQSINYAKRVNSVYNMEFLDTAVPETTPISPLPVRDASLALVLGILGGAMLAILSEQVRMPIESLRRRTLIDQASSAFTRRYFQSRLEEEQARSQTGDIGLGLIQLEGLTGLIDTLPTILAQQLFQEVTRRLRNELRGNDIVGRWGEVEFAVMLPATPVVAAERTLNRIRLALSEPIIVSQTKESVQLNPYTAVVVSGPQEPVKSLIGRAEDSLIQSRRNHLASTTTVSA